MGMLTGKRGIVMGVANTRSIAAGIAAVARQEGAELGFSYLPDAAGTEKMRQRVDKAVSHLQPHCVHPCDVSDDNSITGFFTKVKEEWKTLDFLVHAIAFAPLEDIRCATLDASRSGFRTAVDISAYSLIAVARAAAPLMANGGAIVTLTYYGGEKVITGYNMMGVCKAALDSAVRYLAAELGPRGIRINNISPGPLKTLSASAIASFGAMQRRNAAMTPLTRTLSSEDVGHTAAFLLSDYAAAISGELIHVDNGFHVLGATPTSEA